MSDFNVFNQPRSFYMIFFIELWERFGFYGLQAIFAVYLVDVFNIPKNEGIAIFGVFSALTYGMVSVGGYIGDRVLGTKRTIVLGATVLSIGYFLMAMAHDNLQWIYTAMATVAIGAALFKANPSSLLARCYDENDPRLHGAFTMYYMSINIGSFISMSLVPVLSSKYGWDIGFYVCGFGLLAALASYFIQQKSVENIGSEADKKPLSINKLICVVVGMVAAIVLAQWLLRHFTIAACVQAFISFIAVAVYAWYVYRAEPHERVAMIVAFILILEAIVFFALYMQMPTSLNFYSIKNVAPNILGFNINPISFQALNPFWIVIASPLLAMLYSYFGRRDKDLSMPGKFAVGMLLCSGCFLLLAFSARFANDQGIINSGWLIGSYALQSIGELLISGLGLAMVAELVPKRIHGFTMGIWFLSTAAASFIGSYIAQLTELPSDAKVIDATTAVDTLHIYTKVFWQIGGVTLGVAVLMIVTAPWLARLIRSESDRNKDNGSAGITSASVW